MQEIWKNNHEITPFAARSKFWAKDTYVVIIGFGAHINPKDLSTMDLVHHPVGICLTNDRQNHVYARFDLYNKHSLIPRFDRAEWIIVEGLNLERFEKMDVHGLDNLIHFGQYKGKEIRDIVNADLKYIFWLMRENYLIINEEVLDYIHLNFIDRIDGDAVMINNYRLKEIYDQHDRASQIARQHQVFEIKGVPSKMNGT